MEVITELQFYRIGRIPDSLNINPRDRVVDAVRFTRLDEALLGAEPL